MSQVVKFFLLVVATILAMLLALLGIKTIPTNPSGWFLLLVGVAYTAGVIIAYFVRKERFWDSGISGATTHEERGDRSLWFIALGMIAAFYLSPLEFLYLSAILPRNAWMSFFGIGLIASGIALFIWARRTLGMNYSGHVSVKAGQTLVQSGPYRFIRHPAYLGYLWMALGISLGYSSLAGIFALLVLLLPALIYRINVEEKMLAGHFGDVYWRYAGTTKRLVPGIW